MIPDKYLAKTISYVAICAVHISDSTRYGTLVISSFRFHGKSKIYTYIKLRKERRKKKINKIK